MLLSNCNTKLCYEQFIQYKQQIIFRNVDVYIDGGHRDKNFIASLLTFSPDGAAFRAVNDLGDEIMNAVLPWTKTE